MDSYLKSCIDLELIRQEKNGYSLTDTHLFIVDIRKTGDFPFYATVCKYLQQRGLVPPAYEKSAMWKMIYHFSGSPDYMIASLEKKRIPQGANCAWAYLAKILQVDMTEKPHQEKCSFIL